MHRPLAILLAGLAAACGQSGGGGTSGTPLPAGDDPAELLFCRSRIGAANDAQLRAASSRGLGDVRVLDRSGIESDVRTAPDGNRFVFVRERRIGDVDSREVYLASRDGTVAELRLTVDTAVDASPSWSPDGARVAFVSDRLGAGPRVFVMDADGRDQRPLYDDGTEQRTPDWSWSDGRIAFARRPASGPSAIWVVDADGRVAAPVTDGGLADGVGVGDHDPAWAPDGRSIVFVRETPGGTFLARVDLGSGAVDALTEADGTASLPRWSPRGDRIFFAADRPGAGIAGRGIWTVRPDGTDRLLLFGDRRHEHLGLDVLPDLRPAPPIDRDVADADLGAAQISNGIGRPSRGTSEMLIREDGASFGIATAASNGREVAGIEVDVPLPVADPLGVIALEISVVAALTEVAPDSILRLAITNFEASRNDTIVEITPSGTAAQSFGFVVGNLQHVARDRRTKIAVVGDNPSDRPAELLIDAIRIRVHRARSEPDPR